MWERDLVSRLSPKGSQVLLSLLLSRSPSVQYSSAEFATLTGLGQRSIAPALFELRSYGLIDIIPQPGKPPIVRLVHPEEVRSETTVTEAGIEHLGTTETPALAPPAARVGVDGGEAGTGGIQGVALRPAEGDVEEVERGLLNNCQLADQGQDAGLRIAALQDVWGYAFPMEEYSYQRLSNDAAKRLLVNRSAEWVGSVILDAVKNAKTKIASPRAYIEKAVENQERRLKGTGEGGEGTPTITDDLRNLAKLGKEQFNAQDQNSGGDK